MKIMLLQWVKYINDYEAKADVLSLDSRVKGVKANSFLIKNLYIYKISIIINDNKVII